ncbi:MAG TPA: GatB/YqeY domain-containing protein [Aestuariivirga sp.]
MSLRDQLSNDIKLAMKAGEKKKVATIRLMQAAIKEKDINSRTEGHESALTADPGILDIFTKMVKQRQDSIAAFEKGNRDDLAQNEKDELAIIQTYMPKQMSEDEAKAAVAAVIKAIGASGIKDMGKVMAELKTKFSGQMDMSKAGGFVKGLLG